MIWDIIRGPESKYRNKSVEVSRLKHNKFINLLLTNKTTKYEVMSFEKAQTRPWWFRTRQLFSMRRPFARPRSSVLMTKIINFPVMKGGDPNDNVRHSKFKITIVGSITNSPKIWARTRHLVFGLWRRHEWFHPGRSLGALWLHEDTKRQSHNVAQCLPLFCSCRNFFSLEAVVSVPTTRLLLASELTCSSV